MKIAFLKKIFKKDYIFLIVTASAVIFMVEAIFVYGNLLKKENYYTGLNTIALIDGPVYFSYIEQVKDGNFLFRNLFNSNDDFRVFNPFWLMVGLVAKIFKISSPLIIQIFSIILIPLLVLALYKIIDLLLEADKNKKRLCLIYSLFIAGLGIFIFPFVIYFIENIDVMTDLSLDLWAYESDIFMTLRYYPHAILSLALILFIFYFFLKALSDKGYKNIVIAGFLTLLLFSFHPFQGPLIYGLTLTYLIVKFLVNKKFDFKAIKKYLLLVIISLPSVIYYLFILTINRNLYLKSMQNFCPMPNFLLFLISYGLGLILALYWIYFLVKNKKINNLNLFLIVWLSANIIIVFLPFNFQRRMLGSFSVTVAILSFAAIDYFYQRLKSYPLVVKAVYLLAILFFSTITNLYTYAQNFAFVRESAAGKVDQSYLIFVDPNINSAMTWYKQNALASDTILTGLESGGLLPGLTGKKVYFGHPIETVNFETKRAQAEFFYENNDRDELKKDFLKANQISYIFYSDLEKKLGDFQPAQKDYLSEVYKNEKINIYKVNISSDGAANKT